MKKKTVALQYIQGLPAPFVVAKGNGRLAERLLSIAEEAGVSVMEMPELAEHLFTLEVGEYIPEEYYQVIAEVLVFIRNVKVRT